MYVCICVYMYTYVCITSHYSTHQLVILFSLWGANWIFICYVDRLYFLNKNNFQAPPPQAKADQLKIFTLIPERLTLSGKEIRALFKRANCVPSTANGTTQKYNNKNYIVWAPSGLPDPVNWYQLPLSTPPPKKSDIGTRVSLLTLSPASIIPPILHPHLHIHVPLSRSTSDRGSTGMLKTVLCRPSRSAVGLQLLQFHFETSLICNTASAATHNTEQREKPQSAPCY